MGGIPDQEPVLCIPRFSCRSILFLQHLSPVGSRYEVVLSNDTVLPSLFPAYYWIIVNIFQAGKLVKKKTDIRPFFVDIITDIN